MNTFDVRVTGSLNVSGSTNITGPFTINGTADMFYDGTAPAGTNNTILQAAGNDQTGSDFILDTFNSASISGSTFIGRRARGTATSQSALLVNDIISTFGSIGYISGSTTYGSNVVNTYMRTYALETWTTASQGSTIAFSATVPGTTSSYESVRFFATASVFTGSMIISGSFSASGSIALKGQITVGKIGSLTSSLTTGSGAGTLATASFLPGSTVNSGIFILRTGTAPAAAATIATMTYPTAFPTGSSMTLTPVTGSASTFWIACSGSADKCVLLSTTAALPVTTSMSWNYQIFGF